MVRDILYKKRLSTKIIPNLHEEIDQKWIIVAKKNYDSQLTLGWLRENLASTIGEDLIEQGFSIDKKNTKLKKKVGLKNKIEVYIECYAYSSKVEFKLVFNFYISEIEKEREKFYNYCNLKFKMNGHSCFQKVFFIQKQRNWILSTK
jgi:hypothetical protein